MIIAKGELEKRKEQLEDNNMIDKQRLKALPKILLYCILMIIIWPIGAFFMLKDKQIEKQLRIMETISCFFLWIVFIFCSYMKFAEYQETKTNLNQQTENSVGQIPEPEVTVKLFTQSPTTAPTFQPKTEKPKTTKQPATKKPKATKKPTKKKTKSHRKGMYGISNQDIHDVDATFRADKVRNDSTGNWRISVIANNIDMLKYALSYYKWKFLDDDEIHAIVNFNYNTTTKISVMGNMLDVTVHEYVDGEEHDANLLFGGMLLNEYFVYLDNGDIEKVQ